MKNNRIQAYLDNETYNFIKKVAKEKNLSISNTIENIIIKEKLREEFYKEKKKENKMLSRE